MQNAKDTFYTTLQARLAALNPTRMLVLRGIVRPGTLVDENELPTAAPPTDVFRLAWTGLQLDPRANLSLLTLACTITYATAGTVANAGMDRGRALAAMDSELAQALASEPRSVLKQNYAEANAATAPVAMSTYLFWADPIFGAAEVASERLQRTCTVQVCAYQEAGELC